MFQTGGLWKTKKERILRGCFETGGYLYREDGGDMRKPYTVSSTLPMLPAH